MMKEKNNEKCQTCGYKVKGIGHLCDPKKLLKNAKYYICQGCGLITTDKYIICKPKRLKLR